jgi:choline dehydrogenase-like flavoprotein
VLAAGGIENPRLLLAFNRQRPDGLGNQHDRVGRYFSEHPHVFAARFIPSAAARLGLYHPAHRRTSTGTRAIGAWKLSDETRRREGLADCTSWLSARLESNNFERQLGTAISELDESAPRDAAMPSPGRATYVIASQCEQVPNPQSRVRLTSDLDALGVPRAELDWRLSPIDYQSVRRTHELLGRALAEAGVGRVKLDLPAGDAEWPDNMRGGRHHMGTTRMHRDPRKGVVDQDGRVHGYPNLYVAGSSVFPTVGAANPTFTIVALAVRLAEHLKRVVR